MPIDFSHCLMTFLQSDTIDAVFIHIFSSLLLKLGGICDKIAVVRRTIELCKAVGLRYVQIGTIIKHHMLPSDDEGDEAT